MAKVIGPFMSLDASGTLAGTITASKWKGRNYMRQRVTPSNPQTSAQTGVRSSFAGANAVWKANQVQLTAAFSTLAAQTNISPFNAFVSTTQKRYSRSEHIANSPSPTVEAPANNITALAAEANGRYIDISWTDAVDTEAWATEIYAKLSANPTGVWQELIGIKNRGNNMLTIGPMPSGTYKISGQAVHESGGVIALVTPVEVVIA